MPFNPQSEIRIPQLFHGESHVERGAFDGLDRALQTRRVQVGHLGACDLLDLGARDCADLLLVRLARTLRDASRLLQEVCGGRRGFATIVAGQSPVTGVVEIDVIYTTATRDGRLFYLITIAPEDEMKIYQATFDKIAGSLRLAG